VRMVGIDPGMARCGVAELVDGEIEDLAVYATVKQGNLMRERLAELEADLAPHIIGAHYIAVESPNMPEGASAAAMLWSAFGLIRGLARRQAIIVTFTPGEWRRALGLPTEKRGENDSAGDVERRRKKATEELVLKRYPHAVDHLVGVAKGERNHAYDALALTCALTDLQAKKPAQTTFLEDLDGTSR
jgi:Holliday junction resolvasome RuvABC endonuclease subunit